MSTKDAVTREQVEAWAKLAGIDHFTEKGLERLGDFAIFARQDRANPSAPAVDAGAREAKDCLYEVKYSPVGRDPFWAEVTFEEYETSRLNGSPVRCSSKVTVCKGLNCGSTDGVSHSLECIAEHAAAVAGGRFIARASEAAAGEPIYQVRGDDGCWFDVDEKSHDFANAGFKRIVYTAPPAASSIAGALKKGDMREIDGVIWHCTDPDIDRWVSCGEAASGQKLTDEQIAALRVAADALIERYAEPIRAILRNAERVDGLTVQGLRTLMMRHAKSYSEWDCGSLERVDFGQYGFDEFARALLRASEGQA